MNSSRAFSLLIWLGAGGVALLLAAGVRQVLGASLESQSLHHTLDGVCVFAPVHGDFLSHALSYGTIALLAGVVVLALRHTSRQAMASRTLKTEIADSATGECDEMLQRAIRGTNIKRRVSLITSGKRQAFTAGLWTPSIFVSRSLVEPLSDRQLEAVLLHEEHHARRKDPLRMVVGQALAAMLFFLPVLRSLYNYYGIAKEVDADAVAVQRQATRTHLVSALCKIGGPNAVEVRGSVGFSELGSGEARIEALRTGRWRGSPWTRSSIRWSFAGILLLLALLWRPFTLTQEWWVTVLSLVACPLWLVLFWGHQKLFRPSR